MAWKMVALVYTDVSVALKELKWMDLWDCLRMRMTVCTVADKVLYSSGFL